MADRGTGRTINFLPLPLLHAPVAWPTQSRTAIVGLTRMTGIRTRAIRPVSFSPSFSKFLFPLATCISLGLCRSLEGCVTGYSIAYLSGTSPHDPTYLMGSRLTMRGKKKD
eukprot:4770895-Pleurochrysis_carterae.AAC.1